MNKELFLKGEKFSTKRNIELNVLHTFHYENRRIDRDFLGIGIIRSEIYCIVDKVDEDGINVWMEFFNEYIEKKIYFEQLVKID